MHNYTKQYRLTDAPISENDGTTDRPRVRVLGGVTRLGDEPQPPPPSLQPGSVARRDSVEPAPTGVPLAEYKAAPTLTDLMARERMKRLDKEIADTRRKIEKENKSRPPAKVLTDHALMQKFSANPNRRRIED